MFSRLKEMGVLVYLYLSLFIFIRSRLTVRLTVRLSKSGA